MGTMFTLVPLIKGNHKNLFADWALFFYVGILVKMVFALYRTKLGLGLSCLKFFATIGTGALIKLWPFAITIFLRAVIRTKFAMGSF
jgi:hypothetical protein